MMPPSFESMSSNSLRLFIAQAHPKLAKPSNELFDVEAAVIIGIDLIKALEQLVEVEQVEEKLRKLVRFHPCIPIPAFLQACLLVRPHQRRLVVQRGYCWTINLSISARLTMLLSLKSIRSHSSLSLVGSLAR